MREIWLSIPDFPNYKISNTGRIRNTVSYVELNGHEYENGYLRIRLRSSEHPQGKLLYVHRLVAELFVNNTTHSNRVRHIDGDFFNNYANNLQWIIPQILPVGVRQGKSGPKGQRRSIYIVETEEVFHTQAQCARRLGVSSSRIQQVLESDGAWTVRGYHLDYIDDN